MYDLPLSARTETRVKQIARSCGQFIEIDRQTLEGLGRSVRIKVRVSIAKPLKKGVKVEQRNNLPVWIPFKYERLPTFCYVCGMLGHMKKECDLAEDFEGIRTMAEEKLPYGEWLRASPFKKASVSTERRQNTEGTSSLRRRLFEAFKRNIQEGKELGEEVEVPEKSIEKTENTEVMELVSKTFEKVVVQDLTTEQWVENVKAREGETQLMQENETKIHNQVLEPSTQQPPSISQPPTSDINFLHTINTPNYQ